MKCKILSTATIACLAGLASADIYCIASNAACSPGQQSTYFWQPTGRQGNDNGVSFIAIRGDDMNDVVGSITVGDPNWQFVDVPDIAVNVSSAGERTDIGELWSITGSSASKMWISLIAIKGDLGFFSTTERPVRGLRVRNVSVGGDCYADILANGTELDANGWASLIIDGDWVSGSYANNTAPSIWTMEVGGFAGSINNPIEIWAANRIIRIDIGGDFIGQIGENDEGYAGHPNVENVDIGGDFIGSGAMTMSRLDRLIVGGNFDANVTLTAAMLSSAVLYDIGGEFSASSSLTLPADGLVGQVLINSGDTSNLWDGNIVIGSTTLVGPDELDYTTYYTQLSSELGGGAVGLAPFNFHQRETAPGPGQSMDCNPHQKEVRVLGLADQLNSIDISHYGPVFIDLNIDPAGVIEDIGAHFRVEFLPWMDVNQTWVDRTSLFVVDQTFTSVNDPSGTNRAVRLMGSPTKNAKGFKAAGTWRIRPLTGRVKCGGVSTSPDVEYVSSVVSGDLGTAGSHSWYQFDVRLELQPGVFALDSGNGVEANDLAQWIETPFETNADGVTDSQDFIDMAEQYTGN